jgi:hypothetical protein
MSLLMMMMTTSTGFAQAAAQNLLQTELARAWPIVALGHKGRLACPAEASGRRRVERRLGLLDRHFQEQQKRQLLDVIAVGQTVITQDVQ